jgi:polyhydroxyalkanoate synthesis regulator protein
MPAATQPVLVKRYGAGRLYDTAAGCYVSLGQLRDWLTRRVAFQVVDAATGADITRVLLA